MKRRSPIHNDLRTPKYRPRIVTNKRRKAAREACRNKGVE